MAAVDVFRGYVKLLGAIFEKADWDDLWLRFGLVPPGEKRCLGCGKLIPESSHGHKTSDYCPECWEKRHFVTLKCGQCGKEFKLSRSDYNARLRKRKVPLFFCSKRCWGAYIAQHYGFGVHPEHAGVGAGPRKWDYSKVYSLWEETRGSPSKLSRTLGIPRSTIVSILRKYPTYKPSQDKQNNI